MSEILLRTDNLGKQFTLPGRAPFWAVRNIDLAIRAGEVFGIVGESGSGKSTLGRLLLGLHEKSEGAVYFRDEQLPQRYRRRDFQRYAQQMQMVFQDPYATLNPRLSIGESIAEPLLLSANNPREKKITSKAKKTDDIALRVQQALERVGLAPSSANRFPHEFSGGQRQRIGIARALIAEPALVICDEPVSALDVSVQAQIINLLAQLRREMNLTIVLISHDLAVVRYLCDRIAVMQQGNIVELETTENLFATPQHPFTKKLLAARAI